jgi:flagellar biosynthetic protein FliR
MNSPFMNLFSLSRWDPELFVLILARTSGVLIALPAFNTRAVPTKVKALMAVALSALLFPLVGADAAFREAGYDLLLLNLFSEFMVGVSIGFCAYLIFAAVALGGQLAGVQAGFGIVDVINPLGVAEVPLLGNFQTQVAFLIFLATNAQYAMIWALARSYEIIRIGGGTFGGHYFDGVIHLFGSMMSLGLVLASPFIVGGVILNLVLGFLSKMMPQMNLISLGLPVMVLGGIVLTLLGLPFFGTVLEKTMGSLDGTLRDLLEVMARHGG